MAKKQFKIRARLAFRGEFLVRAASREQAEEKIRKAVRCSLVQVDCLDEDVVCSSLASAGEIEVNRRLEGEEMGS